MYTFNKVAKAWLSYGFITRTGQIAGHGGLMAVFKNDVDQVALSIARTARLAGPWACAEDFCTRAEAVEDLQAKRPFVVGFEEKVRQGDGALGYMALKDVWAQLERGDLDPSRLPNIQHDDSVQVLQTYRGLHMPMPPVRRVALLEVQ